MAIVQKCACGRSSGPQEKPIISRYLTEYPGQAIVMDTFFPHEPEPGRFPAVIVVCNYSRFVMAKFLPSARPECYTAFLIDRWAMFSGFPQTILCDNSTTFGGPHWKAICHVFDMQLLPAPTRAAFQIGMVERHVGILKYGYKALARCNTDHLSKNQLLSLACVARNMSPLISSHLTPLMIVTGRDHSYEFLGNVPHAQSWKGSDDSPSARYFRRLTSLIDLRSQLIRFEADQMLKLALSKTLRKGAALCYKIGDAVQSWNPKTLMWENGSRLLAETGRNAIVEQGRHLMKIPIAWIRKKLDISIIEDGSSVGNKADRNVPIGDLLDVSSDAKKTEPSISTSATKVLHPSMGEMCADSSASSNDPHSDSAPSRSTVSRTQLTLDPDPYSAKESSLDSSPLTFFPTPRYNLRSNYRNLWSRSETENEIWWMAGSSAVFHSVEKDCPGSNAGNAKDPTPTVSENMVDEFTDSYGCNDLSRIPGKIMIQEPLARESLRKELYGILQCDTHGIPIGKLMPFSPDEVRAATKLHSTAATKLRNGKGFKSRLCIRGDQQSEAVASFMSPPTAGREYLRIATSLFVGEPLFEMAMVDASQAFTQSDYYHSSDRISVILPKCVRACAREWLVGAVSRFFRIGGGRREWSGAKFTCC